jgi:hypothetical protein
MFPNASAVYILSLETRESITSIEYISASGSYIPGFLILLSQLLLEGQFKNNIYPNYVFSTNKESGSGYSNNNILVIN